MRKSGDSVFHQILVAGRAVPLLNFPRALLAGYNKHKVPAQAWGTPYPPLRERTAPPPNKMRSALKNDHPLLVPVPVDSAGVVVVDESEAQERADQQSHSEHG